MKVPVPKPDFGALAAKARGIVPALRAKLPARLGGTGAPKAVRPPDDGIPDHLKPTFFQRNAHILPVVGAYAVLALIVLGTATYLLLNEEAILAERDAMRPVTQITEFDVLEGPEPAETVPVTAEAPSPSDAASEESTVASSDGTVAPAEPALPPPPPVDGPDPYAGNLAPYPDPGLIEQIETLGQLPRIGDDNRLPWKVYSRPSSSLETRPRISIVILNLGLSTSATERAIRLPGAVTLSFSPYARGLDEWIRQARDAGHEVLVGLPMEPRDFPRSDAGLLQLQTSYEPEQNILNLHRVMSTASGYIGLTNLLGSGFTSSRASVQPVMEDLAKRGLVYFDTLENATSVAPEMAAKAGAPAASADLLVDQTMSRPTVVARLAQIELLAKSQGTAIVAVQPFPMLMNRADSWARDLGGKGMVLTPLSGVITARLRGS